MILTQKQKDLKRAIELYSEMFGVDPDLAVAISLTESSLGLNPISPTKARGPFHMTTIAAKDVLYNGDEFELMILGLLFLRLLKRRWGNMDDAISHFCDEKDRWFYVDRVKGYREEFKQMGGKENGQG